MKRIIAQRAMALFLACIVACSGTLTVFAEAGWNLLPEDDSSPFSLPGVAAGVATPTNLSDGGWPGVATPTDLADAWQSLPQPNNLAASAGKLILTEQSSGTPMTRLYLTEGQSAVFHISMIEPGGFLSVPENISDVQISFTHDTQTWDASAYFDASYDPESQTVTLTAKQTLPTFEASGMVNGYRMNCTVSIGEGTNCAYLYLLKEPVAVDIYNDASGAVYTAGESYSMALDPSLAGLGSSVSVYALTSDSSEPFGGIQASISPGQDAILLNIAQDCASGFYSIRLNSEWEGKYVFTDCLIYVTDLVFYSDDSGAPAGEITPSLPFDRDREYNLTLGDINGPYDAEDLQSVQVSSTTLMTISGNGAHFTMKPTGESGSEELIVQATLKDGSVRRGILSLRASATLPVMLLSSPDLQAPVSFAVAQPREFVFYLDGYSAAEQNERVRLKDVQVIDAANLTIEPDFEAGTATVTSTRGSVYASATLQVVYEVYDFISNSWNERTGSFSLRGFSSPKAHLNTVLVDLDSMQPLYSLVMEKGAVYRVQAAWRDSSSGSESYHTWPEDADFSFVLQRGGSIINVPNSFRQETLGMDVYFDVKPIDGVVRGYELTCKQVPVSLENGLEWNYSLKIDAGPLYSAYLSASLYKPSPTTDNPIYVDGVENRSSSTAVFGKIPTEITSGIAAERIGSGEKPIASSYTITNLSGQIVNDLFDTEDLGAGVRITAKEGCPNGQYYLAFKIEFEDIFIQTHLSLYVSDIFLVTPDGTPVTHISSWDYIPNQGFSFMDYYGTVTADRIRNLTVTGGEGEVAVVMKGETLHLNLLTEYSSGKLHFRIELTDGFVQELDIPYSLGSYTSFSVTNVETGEPLSNYTFRQGTSATFRWEYTSSYPEDAVFAFESAESVARYFDVTIDQETQTFTLLPKKETDNFSFSCGLKRVGNDWMYTQNSFNVSILADRSIQIVRVDGESGSIDSSGVQIRVELPCAPQMLQSLEVKATSPHITVTDQGDQTYLITQSNLLRPYHPEYVYAVATYTDGTVEYDQIDVVKSQWIGLQQLSPNRKPLRLAFLNQDGSFSPTMASYFERQETGTSTQYLYVTEGSGANGSYIPVREGIKELTATSSNPDLVSVNGPLLTVDQTAYYFECTTDVTSVGEAEILVTVTYDNGIVRQMNALIAMYESTNQYTSLEVSPELLKEKNMTLQQFIDSSELPPSLGSMQTALYLAEGEYEGDLVLKKPLQVHGTASYDEGLQAWVAGSTIKGSIRAESGSYLSNLHIVGTNEPSTVGVSGPRNTYVTIYTCLIEGFEIGVDSCFMNSCVVCGCTVGCLDSPFTNSTLKNNDIGARVTIPYLAPNRNRFINNGLHIQNTASYPLLAEQNYFRMDTETDVKEFPYAACFEGNVDVEPYYEDYEMTHLSVVPDEPSGEIELKPENNEVVINITNPTSSQVSSEIFEKAKQSAAAENEEEKVETLTFEVKSSEGETNVKWEFKTSELTNTSISPSLSVKLDFDQLLPEEGNLTEQEQTAKEDIADILEQVAEQGGQSVKYQSISFVHQGDLPGPATVTIQKNAALTDANNLKLYYYNPETSSLELYDDVVIIDNGDSISFTITHCSEYIITPSEIDPDICAVYKITLNGGSKLILTELRNCLSNIQPNTTVGEVRSQLEKGNEMTVENLRGQPLNDSSFIGTGTTIYYKNASIEVLIFGDVNGDGKIMTSDLLPVQSILLGKSDETDLSDKQRAACRASAISSSDAPLTVKELLAIRAHILKLGTIPQDKTF